MVFLYSKPAR
ncbi:hypothetical protein E2C01_091281 [Portunus trituberculatus]|uniref:Uncharacterized protein n=1 Tax=Portunus trituberculatus TaxID=210409 RepID=A0A5B7JN55_PORTR|nr:hypothetical protein [Portunus trituberculatus]